MNNAEIVNYENVFYLTKNIEGLNLYQRTLEIEKFIKSDTKVLEKCIDTHLREIFAKHNIKILETNKSALNDRFSALKQIGVTIEINDIYKSNNYDNAVVVGISDNQMTCILEDDYMLSCAIEIKEVKS